MKDVTNLGLAEVTRTGQDSSSITVFRESVAILYCRLPCEKQIQELTTVLKASACLPHNTPASLCPELFL